MIIDTIKPTFSIDSAKNYFLFSTDDKQTWESAESIKLKYYALNKMENFTNNINPLRLSFKETSDNSANNDFKITKILVNEASEFLEGDLGENVISTSTQNAVPNKSYAGKYVTYDSVTTGGLNFRDFKIQSILNSEMQMIIYVTGKINLIIECQSKMIDVKDDFGNPIDKVGLRLYFITRLGNRTEIEQLLTPDTKKVQFTTKADLFIESNNPDVSISNESFTYGAKLLDFFSVTKMVANQTQTGAYDWELDINEKVWQSEPRIEIYPTSISGTYVQRTGWLIVLNDIECWIYGKNEQQEWVNTYIPTTVYKGSRLRPYEPGIYITQGSITVPTYAFNKDNDLEEERKGFRFNYTAPQN